MSLPYLTVDKVHSYIAIEPAVGLHAALQSCAAAAGLDKKIRIMSCGGESGSLVPALSAAGVLAPDQVTSIGGQVLDTIISVRSLCSIQHPQESIQMHYALLRPGGRYVICEHVLNPWPASAGSLFGRFMQVTYTALGWSFFVGGCRLSQDTIRMLEMAGPWSSVELQRDSDWGALPFVTGVFIK